MVQVYNPTIDGKHTEEYAYFASGIAAPLPVQWYLNGPGCVTPMHVDSDHCYTLHKV